LTHPPLKLHFALSPPESPSQVLCLLTPSGPSPQVRGSLFFFEKKNTLIDLGIAE
jgi:hypothetical protein